MSSGCVSCVRLCGSICLLCRLSVNTTVLHTVLSALMVLIVQIWAQDLGSAWELNFQLQTYAVRRWPPPLRLSLLSAQECRRVSRWTMGDMRASKSPSTKVPRLSTRPTPSEEDSAQVSPKVCVAVSPQHAEGVVSRERAQQADRRKRCRELFEDSPFYSSLSLDTEPPDNDWQFIESQPVLSFSGAGPEGQACSAAGLSVEPEAATALQNTFSPSCGVCSEDRISGFGRAPSPSATADAAQVALAS